MTQRRPIRVLNLIARLNVGGPAKHVGWLMAGLDSARFDQHLASGRLSPGEDDMGPWLEAQGISWEHIPTLSRAIRPLADLKALFAVLGLMRRHRPHILATHTAKAGFLGRLALMLYRPWAWLRGWPSCRAVHTFHGHVFHGYFGRFKTRVFLFLERFLAKRATWRIVAISPAQKEEILGRFKVGREEQYVVMPLGIDLDMYRDPDGRRRFRAELAAQEDELLVGAVGRVAPVKNYGLFLEAAARLRRLAPELYQLARWVLIGGGAQGEMAWLEAQAKALGLAGKVVFAGNRGDPECFFQGLDALMLTSVNEGTPMAILEGGAAGLPVLATRVGGVPDLLGAVQGLAASGVERRERGLTAASGDAESLARGLALLLSDAKLRLELGGQLRDFVRAGYGKQRLCRDIAALYEQAATDRIP